VKSGEAVQHVGILRESALELLQLRQRSGIIAGRLLALCGCQAAEPRQVIPW
jgi:hypothetical protein